MEVHSEAKDLESSLLRDKKEMLRVTEETKVMLLLLLMLLMLLMCYLLSTATFSEFAGASDQADDGVAEADRKVEGFAQPIPHNLPDRLHQKPAGELPSN